MTHTIWKDGDTTFKSLQGDKLGSKTMHVVGTTAMVHESSQTFLIHGPISALKISQGPPCALIKLLNEHYEGDVNENKS